MKIIVLIASICIFIGAHEWQHYQECLRTCVKQHVADLELLNRDVCVNAYDRLQFRDTVDCEGAEQRVSILPHTCAFNSWRANIEPVVWLKKLREHFWVTVGIAVVLCMWTMYLVMSYYNHQGMDERYYKKQSKFVDKMLKLKSSHGFDNRITSK